MEEELARMNLAEKTVKEIWDYIKRDTDGFRYMALDDSK